MGRFYAVNNLEFEIYQWLLLSFLSLTVRYFCNAFRSKEHEATLAAANVPSQCCEKGSRGHLLTDAQKASNRIKSKVRARVEHIFGAQAQMGGHIVRTIGLGRAKIKIGMMNLVNNMKRLMQLMRRDRIDAPAMA